MIIALKPRVDVCFAHQRGTHQPSKTQDEHYLKYLNSSSRASGENNKKVMVKRLKHTPADPLIRKLRHAILFLVMYQLLAFDFGG
jgi:hypothetical protein